MSESVEGGCLCGKVRYKAKSIPKLQIVCHCTSCQKQSGSAFSTGALVPKADFELTGETRTYRETAASGNEISRIFCPNCGSTLYFEVVASPDAVVLQVGTADDRSWFRPRVNFWTERAHEWVAIDPDCKNFPRNPG